MISPITPCSRRRAGCARLAIGDQHRAVGREVDAEGRLSRRPSPGGRRLAPHERADLQLSPGLL
jgi:hypothetical protein